MLFSMYVLNFLLYFVQQLSADMTILRSFWVNDHIEDQHQTSQVTDIRPLWTAALFLALVAVFTGLVQDTICFNASGCGYSVDKRSGGHRVLAVTARFCFKSNANLGKPGEGRAEASLRSVIAFPLSNYLGLILLFTFFLSDSSCLLILVSFLILLVTVILVERRKKRDPSSMATPLAILPFKITCFIIISFCYYDVHNSTISTTTTSLGRILAFCFCFILL